MNKNTTVTLRYPYVEPLSQERYFVEESWEFTLDHGAAMCVRYEKVLTQGMMDGYTQHKIYQSKPLSLWDKISRNVRQVDIPPCPDDVYNEAIARYRKAGLL